MFQPRQDFELADSARDYLPDDIQVASRRIVMLERNSEIANLRKADTVVLGPGSLYTGILPALAAPGVVDAIIESKARVIYVMNLMTEPGETDGYTAADFVKVLRQRVPTLPLHYLLQNSREIPSALLQRYGSNGAKPIAAALSLSWFPCQCVARDLLSDTGNASATHAPDKIRHDPVKLQQAILELSAWHHA